jgi:hypothetical protein
MRTRVHHPTGAHQATRRAWVAVAFIPVGFVASMVVGEGLFALQGYDSTDEDAPTRAVALAGGVGILVFVIPCLVAWLLGRRAVADGEASGSTPALVAALIGVAFVLLNLVGVVARIVGS